MAESVRTIISRKYSLATVAIFLLVCCAVSLQADEVVLVNGDKLTGTIDSIVGGKLKLNSPLLGTVEIDMIHVESVSSDASIPVVLSDGTTVMRRLGPAATGKVSLQDEQQKRDVEWGQITAVNPPPAEPPAWKGSISAGLTSIHGNTRSDSMNASLSMSKRRELTRTTLGADYGRSTQRDDVTGKNQTTEDWWRAMAKHDYFFSKKFYGYLEGRYQTDKIARLDRRIIGGVGAGYQWIESEDMNFSTEGGLAYISEKYKDGDSDDRMSVQLGYNFDKKLNDWLKFKHNLSYFPSLEKFSDYYLTTSAELRAGLTKSMFTNFRTILDYDATPAEGKGSTDIKYMLGIGLDF